MKERRGDCIEWCNQSTYIRHVGIVLTEIFQETGTNFPSQGTNSTLISHFLCILRMPESSGAASVVVREDGCEIENKGERGDLDVNNISEPLIL